MRPEAGRFRSFLRAALKHFPANEWHCEQRYQLEPADRASQRDRRKIGISVNTVGVMIHRLRRRYGEIIREIISETVAHLVIAHKNPILKTTRQKAQIGLIAGCVRR